MRTRLGQTRLGLGLVIWPAQPPRPIDPDAAGIMRTDKLHVVNARRHAIILCVVWSEYGDDLVKPPTCILGKCDR